MERDSYYAIVALSARQTMGAYVLTTRPGTIDWPESQEPMMFQKEISSNGNVNTVDVMYPAMPFFLYTNPMLLKYSKSQCCQMTATTTHALRIRLAGRTAFELT